MVRGLNLFILRHTHTHTVFHYFQNMSCPDHLYIFHSSVSINQVATAHCEYMLTQFIIV